MELCSQLYSLFLISFLVFIQGISKIKLLYKIVKEILSRPKKEILNKNIKIPKSKTIKFENTNIRNKNILNNDNQSFNTSKSVPFKSKGINLTNKIKIKNKLEYISNYNYNFGKINFIHFIFNNIYFKRKNGIKQQEIIDICNSISSKYTSIDVIFSP